MFPNKSTYRVPYTWDIQSDVMEISQEAAQVFGAGAALEVVDRNWWLERIHLDDRQRVQDALEAALNDSAGAYQLDYRICNPAGVWVMLRDEAYILRDADGKARRVNGFACLSAQPRAAEQELLLANQDLALKNDAFSRTQELFRVALANAAVAVFQTDLDLRYTWIYSPYFYEFAEMMTGKRDDEVFTGEGMDELLEIKWQALSQKQVVRRELLLDFGDQPRVLIVSVEPFFEAGAAISGVIGSFIDVTEQRRLEARELETTFLLDVKRRLLEHRDQDCQVIASYIYEGPIQNLSSLGFSIQIARELSASCEDVSVMLDQLGDGVKSLVGELREVTDRLRPQGVIRLGLIHAMRAWVFDFRKRYPQIRVNMSLPRLANQVPENVCLVFYAVLQESMTNIGRHARAEEVWITLSVDPGEARLEIKDDGLGFDLPSSWAAFTRQGCYGLALIKERVEAVGGELVVQSTPKAGTAVQAAVRRG